MRPAALLLPLLAAAWGAGLSAQPEPQPANAFAQATPVLFGVPMPAASSAPPAPSPAPGSESPPTPGGRDAPPEGRPTPPTPPPGQRIAATRPLGFLRVLHDVAKALLDLLRAAGGLLLVLWHRLGPARLLESPTRRRIVDEVARAPGRSVTALAQSLGMNRKTLSYHLRRLEGAHLALRRQGPEALVYPLGAAPPQAPPTADRLLALVRQGIGEREALAHALGVSPQAVSQHLARLEAEGRVRTARVGRRRVARPA